MPNPETIILGAGCFWCTEAVFARVPGVLSVMPGYAGGHTAHPTYEQVCSGTTGHAEVAEVRFDPKKVSLERLLAIFFAMHDPTTPDRQGNDTGPQYRSIILWTDERQQEVINRVLEAAQVQFPDPIVTEVGKLEAFYPAEVDHREYYEKNPGAPYCTFIIAPKLEKLEKSLRLSQI
ncbi:MAG: peptide-methionine (S)-S-oxide reductase MsrA [Candidatus Peribacteraceae bacterium]|nr:peptide-methionine (S)-S-oxide reductase MsrA [Candidatus Peribacteraceae bacterium]